MKGLVLTYLLAYGGSLVALFNPFVGVCIYWMFDIVRPQYMFAWAGVDGAFSATIAVTTLIGWAFKGFGNWQFGRGAVLVWLFLASGAWALGSAVLAPNSDIAYLATVELLKRSTMFVVAVTLADSVERVKRLAWVVAGSAAYVCLELNLSYLSGFNAVQVLGYGGMDNNSIAVSLVTCLGLALFLGLYAKPLWQKAIAFGGASLIGHAVLLTFSRGGLLAMIVAGTAAVAVIPKRPRYFMAVLGAVVLGVLLAGPEVRARFATAFSDEEERDASAQSRVALWMDCITVMKKYPIFGVGPDHFPLIVEEFGWPPGKEAHSLWLQVGAEMGVPAMLLLLTFYLTAIKRLWPLARAKTGSELDETDADRWGRHAACMVVTSLAGFIVAAQFVTMEGLETPLYVAAIAVGTLRLVTRPEERRALVSNAPAMLRPAPQALRRGSAVMFRD